MHSGLMPKPASILRTLLLLALVGTAAEAQPTFTKTFVPDTIGPGSVSTLRFDITNGSGTPATDLDFTDGLPIGVTIATPANATSTCGDLAALTAPDGGGTITFTGGEVGGSSSCVITVDVTSSAVGVHMNDAGLLSSSAGNSPQPATADLTVDGGRPGFSKSFAPATIGLGGRSTLTFTIDNGTNPSDVTFLDFTDTFPPGIEIADPANASTTCDGPSGLTLTAVPGTSVVFFLASGSAFPGFEVLPFGETCTVTVDVIGTGVGMLINVTGELTSFDTAPFESSGKASATLEVTSGTLTLQKAFTDDPVLPGGTVTLDFRIDNFDRVSSATAITFTDNLDATLPGLSSTDLPKADVCGAGSLLAESGPPTTLTLTGGSLPGEGFCTFFATLAVPGAVAGAFPNTTSPISGDVGGTPFAGGAAADTLFVEPGPVLTKTFLSDPAEGGDTVSVELTITNSSTTSTATDIAFSDNITVFLSGTVVTGLPADGSCGALSEFDVVSVGFESIFTMEFGELAPSGSCTLTVDLLIPIGAPPGTYVNTTSDITATVDAATATGPPASDTLTIVRAPILSKSFTDDPVPPGGTVTLELTLTHSPSATSDATGITFTDDLDATLAGLASISGTQNDICGAGSALSGTSLLTLMNGTLMPGETCTLSVTLQVPAAAPAGTFPNTTSGVGATVGGLALTSPAATADLRVAGLTFSKEFLGDPVLPGATLTLRFTIENIDPTDDATITFFTDSLSTALAGLAATGPASLDTCGGSLSGTTFLTYVGGSVMSQQTCTIEVEVLVPGAAPDGAFRNTTSSLSATLGGSPVTVDPAVDDLVVDSNLLSLFKEITDDPVAPGDNVTLELTLTNLDPAQAASGIDFTDDLDAALSGLTYDSLLLNDCGGSVTGIGSGVITVTGASLAAGGSCTIRVSLTVPGGADANVYTNTTSDVTGTIGGLTASGVAASDDLEVVDLLLFSKSFDGPTTAGDTPVLTFTITNPGPETATDLVFSDNLDLVVPGLAATGLPLADVCGSGSLLSGTSVLTLTGGELPPTGGTCSFDVDLLVPGTAGAGDFLNTTSELFQAGLPVAEPATATLTVLEADLEITKTDGVISAAPGTSVTYTIVATNNGPSDVPAASVTDTFPAGLSCTYTSVAAGGATGNTAAGAGDLSDTLSMPALSSVTYTVGCTIPSSATGVLSNTASIASADIADLTPGNNSTTDDDTVLAAQADLEVTKTDGVTTAVPGQALTYTIVVTNNGPSDDPAATLTDTFPADLTCTYTSVAAGGATGNTAAGAGDLAETLSLPSGSSVTYTVDCTIDPAATGTLSNTAAVTASVTDGIAGNNSATDGDTLLDPEADLSVTKTDGVTSAVPGQSLTYTIVVSNAGPSDDPSATLDDSFPAPPLTCTYTSVAAGGATGNTTSGAGDLAETLSLPAGSSVTYTVDCTIDPAATGTLSNTAAVTASVTDGNAGNDSATDGDTVLDPEADLEVTKTDGVTTAVPGQSLTYTIVVTSNGPSDDPAATLTDALPADLSCTYTSVAAGGATGNTAAGAGDLAETLSLPVGSSVTYTAVCTIDPGATGTLSNTATVTASVTDPAPGDNSATDGDTVLDPQADLEVTKTDGATTAVPGQSLTYTIVVSNAGPSDDGSGLFDPFPAALSCTYTSVAAGGALVNMPSGSGDINELLGLPAGSSVTYTVDCTIDPAATGTLSNTATVTALVATDPVPGNNSATDGDTVLVPTADLAITKDGPAVATVGQSLTYTLTVSNNGPSTAANTRLDDPTPPGLLFNAASAPCAGGFPCDLGDVGPGGAVVATATFDVPFDYSGPDPIANTATVASDAQDDTPANNSATATTDIVTDGIPPEVTDVSTAAGPLATCDTVRLPVASIQVTIEDDLTPVLNAEDPQSYLLVGSGPDADFSTTACGPAVGDDVPIEILSLSLVSVDPVLVDVNVRLEDAINGLAPGLYRFFVCDTVTDAAGNALDGDGDSTPGGDFQVPFFRADPFNLFENGNFDNCPVTLDPWVAGATAPNVIVPGTPGIDDVDASPHSASARFGHSTPEAGSIARCVDAAGGTSYGLLARLRFDPFQGALALFEATCELFDGAACGGASLGSSSSLVVLEDGGGDWIVVASNVSTPAGTVSALCDFTLEAIGSTPNFDLFLDGLFLGENGLIFTDGFESGDTSAWSATVP